MNRPAFRVHGRVREPAFLFTDEQKKAVRVHGRGSAAHGTKKAVRVHGRGAALHTEQKRRFAYTGVVQTMQRVYRGHLGRKAVKLSRELQREIRGFLQKFPLYQAENQHGQQLFGGLAPLAEQIEAGNKLVCRAYKASPVPPAVRESFST